jgi:hypothetical protein
LLTDDIHLSLTERDGLAILQLNEVRDLGQFREFCVVSVLRNALGEPVATARRCAGAHAVDGVAVAVSLRGAGWDEAVTEACAAHAGVR